MNGDREQEEEQPEPPPALACTLPRAGRRMWRRSKFQCDEHGPCCGKHEERNTEPGKFLLTHEKLLSPENVNDEVMEWNESTGEIPAEIWEVVEEDDRDRYGDCGRLDESDKITSVSQPSGDREPAICHKLAQTELRREEVGVQTESANTFEYIDTADFPPLGPCKSETLDAHSITHFRSFRVLSEADQTGYLPHDLAAGRTGD